MDITLKRAADRVIADLVANGGGTYEQGTLLPWSPPTGDGFAVAIGGVTLPEGDTTSDTVAWAMRAVAGEFMTSFVGTWLDKGTVYIDGVRYFAADRREAALALARECGQLAIYDFGSATGIEVPS